MVNRLCMKMYDPLCIFFNRVLRTSTWKHKFGSLYDQAAKVSSNFNLDNKMFS